LNLSYFISKRISRQHRDGFATTLHRIAIASIGVGLAATIVSFLIMKGFQETVKNKIFSFTGHLVITRMTMSSSTEEDPLNYHLDVLKQNNPRIDHVQEYAHKPGLIKTDDEVLGTLVKGVGKSFDVKAFQQNMLEGDFITFSDSSYARQVVISKIISNKLKLKVGDDIVVHFFQNPPRFRKLKITGIYQTNLSEYFDNKVILADIRMIQRLNDWSDSLAGGIEVFVKNASDIDEVGYAIGDATDFDVAIDRVSDKFSQVFEWLNLVSRQVNVLLAIILIVVCVNMISIVLILVMERTQMIGMLKALGAANGLVRSVFMFSGINLIVKGLILGNVVGLGLCWIQDYFKIVKLNPHDYYMNVVPISWNWEIVFFLNLITFSVVTVVLLVPTLVIARIEPIKAIRFD